MWIRAIYLSSHDIRVYRLTDLPWSRRYVPQDQFLFATSILDSPHFGNPNLPLSAREATKLTQVYQDIVDMPQFDTLIGEKESVSQVVKSNDLAMSRAMILDLIS